MKTMISRTFSALLMAAAVVMPAYAADSGLEGEIAVKGIISDINGEASKFDEYDDTRDAVTGDVRLSYDSNRYFLKFDAADIGRETQKYGLTGGMWGKFDINLFYAEMPHNITFGAKTFYSGIGGHNLTGVPGPLSTWSSFDYSTERKRMGGGLKLDFLNPFFLDIWAQSEKKEGIRPTAGGDFAGVTELPEPVDYRTDAFSVEAGYSKKPFFASLGYYFSKFNNENQALDFANPFFGPDSVTLSPDNRYDKVSFKAAVFLPYRSKLSLNMGKASARSEGDANSVIGVSDFDGRVDTKNLDLVLTSNPVKFLDARVFYKYFDRDNKSEDTVWDFGYTNRAMGGQFGFKFPANFRLMVGYTNRNTSYEDRPDARDRKDNTYSADIAWSGLDFAVFKVGYENMHRTLDREGSSSVWKFDVAPFDRDTFKASVDLFPVDNLSVTLGYKYKKSDYEKSDLGLKEDRRDEVYLDASYVIGRYARVYGYLDYEKVRRTSLGLHNSIVPGGYEWEARLEDKSIDYGIGTDIFIIPRKLTLKLRYDYVRSDGDADFTYLDPAALLGGRTNSNIDMSNWDDYRKRAFSVKAIYDVVKAFSVSAGFAHEQLQFSDAQYDGYQHVFVPGSSYLTGAYKEMNYSANVVFLALTYRF